jgi:SAM-dependent methyltransferase
VQSTSEHLFAKRGRGVLVAEGVSHRDDEYDPSGFHLLRDMQSRHFWYRGRHRFLLDNVRRALGSRPQSPAPPPAAIDLGGGCGGWIAYLKQHAPQLFGELALADSSMRALEDAESVVGPEVARYQIDLMQLPWEDRWDAAFLLDVLEHIPDDVRVLREIHRALRPGGYLFVTTPALKFFWTYNDEFVHHVRRYSRVDFARLAAEAGFQLYWSRYFMFLLSPLLVLSRLRRPRVDGMRAEDIQAHLARTHRVPSPVVNAALGLVFSAETPLGTFVPFPWGTSILGVFRKNES